MITPCINRCQLDRDSKKCLGCKRTTKEITEWSKMTDDERIKVIQDLQNR